MVNGRMTHLVSVITPTHGPAAPYLADAHSSLTQQEMPPPPAGLIQEDGETDGVHPHVPGDSRISFDQGRNGRAGIARTMALARARGDLVKVLDADDKLTPGALLRDITVLTEQSGITCRPSWLALVDGTGSVAEAGGGAARHTRAWSADAPTVVADCRRLRFVPQPCQMQGSVTVNDGAPQFSCQARHQVAKLQLNDAALRPLSYRGCPARSPVPYPLELFGGDGLHWILVRGDRLVCQEAVLVL